MSIPTKNFILKDLYIDNPTCIGNTIKVTNNKDVLNGQLYINNSTHIDPIKAHHKDCIDNQLDYQKLQAILAKQFGCYVSIEEAALIGKSLLNIYEILLD